MSSSLDDTYAAALALNNMGVTLLARCLYAEALRSLHSAVMKLQESRDDHRLVGSTETSEMLHSAYRSLADNALPHSRLDLKTGIQMKIAVIDEEDITDYVRCCVNERRIQQNDSSCPLPLILVRMELSATSISTAQSYFGGLDLSILFYNFGIAYLVAANLVDTKQTLFLEALELFQMSAVNLDSSIMTRSAEELYASNTLPFSFFLLQSFDRVAELVNRLPDNHGNVRFLMTSMFECFASIKANDYICYVTAASAA